MLTDEEQVWFQCYSALRSTQGSSNEWAAEKANKGVEEFNKRFRQPPAKTEPSLKEEPMTDTATTTEIKREWKHGDRVIAGKLSDHQHKGTIVVAPECTGIVLDEPCAHCMGIR